jgi:hypothetical protein
LTAVGSPVLNLAGVIGSLSEYFAKGSLFLFLFAPATPSSYSLSVELTDMFSVWSKVSFVFSATPFVLSTTASFTSFAFPLTLTIISPIVKTIPYEKDAIISPQEKRHFIR